VCLVGDAAHAAAPHHGAGAGFAIEDAVVLAVVLEDAARVCGVLGETPSDCTVREEVLRTALLTYESIRLERTRWLIETSRYMGELYERQVDECGSDAAKCLAEVEARCHRIWDCNIDDMWLGGGKVSQKRREVEVSVW
jgi:salicylate hydroxylase